MIHAAGVHLARSDQAEGNAATIRQHFDEDSGRRDDFQVIRVADWDEGIAMRPGLGLGTIREVINARLRWVVREPGSGAQQCLDELLGRGVARPDRRCSRALDHRGVAEAIRGQRADAGICLRIAGEEAGLSFLSVRQEAYEICMPEGLLHDPRGRACLKVIRSPAYRRLLDDLPGYSSARTGDLQPVPVRR